MLHSLLSLVSLDAICTYSLDKGTREGVHCDFHGSAISRVSPLPCSAFVNYLPTVPTPLLNKYNTKVRLMIQAMEGPTSRAGDAGFLSPAKQPGKNQSLP